MALVPPAPVLCCPECAAPVLPAVLLTFGDLIYRPRQRQLQVGERLTLLCKRESQLLALLMSRPREYHATESLMQAMDLWENSPNSIYVATFNMRRALVKLRSGAEVRSRQTVGYGLFKKPDPEPSIYRRDPRGQRNAIQRGMRAE